MFTLSLPRSDSDKLNSLGKQRRTRARARLALHASVTASYDVRTLSTRNRLSPPVEHFIQPLTK